MQKKKKKKKKCLKVYFTITLLKESLESNETLFAYRLQIIMKKIRGTSKLLYMYLRL